MKLKNELKYIETGGRKMRIIILRPEEQSGPLPGILWIHGGGYTTGMAAMVFFSCGRMLAEKFGAVLVSPEYRLAPEHPYPAALEDCYAALSMMVDQADELGIRRDKIVVGGESAGGGLAAAVCLYARDQGKIRPAMQIPLYPMLDCEDTPSSADNHGHVWDTKRNHKGWAAYLGESYGTDRVPKYASPSRETDYAGLPPAYSYVEDGEPFYCETLTYIENLKAAGIDAQADVFHGNIHAFDALFWTEKSRDARTRLCEAYERIIMKDVSAPAPEEKDQKQGSETAKKKVYIACPLFNEAERAFNEKIDAILRDCGYETYLPQRDGGVAAEMPDLIDGVPKRTYIFQKDCQNLDECDILLMLMDGRVPDEGACIELGYCFARGKRCIGYQTDIRKAFEGDNNIMLNGALETILHSEDELRNYFGERLR